MNKLEKRIIDLSYKHKLSHISSCLTSVNIIDRIYSVMRPQDVFVLGNSHAALALFVVLEQRRKKDAEDLLKRHGTHANRNLDDGIFVSGGSLGQPETVALGIALASPQKNVYLVTSDGAFAEGSIWETLRVARHNKVENLRITVVADGTSGLDKVDIDDLDTRINAFYPTLVARTNLYQYPSWVNGVGGHYVVMDKEKYEEIIS